MIKNIVVLTGAGISAESGIPVFRSETGLWEQERVEDVATYDGFLRNKNKVHGFYNKMRLSLSEKQANAAHLALSKLQREWKQGTVTLVTQNIDNLHEKAESQNIIHMHGELMSLRCERCDYAAYFDGESSVDSVCPSCGHKGCMRPDIVWFGETPYQMALIEERLSSCNLFIAIGTSGVVYPAAGFCRFAKAVGATCVEFNLAPSAVGSSFDYGLYGKASETLPPFVDYLLKTGQLLKAI